MSRSAPPRFQSGSRRRHCLRRLADGLAGIESQPALRQSARHGSRTPMPILLRLLLKSMGGISHGDREKELAQLKKRVPPADYAVFVEPGRLEAFGQAMRECMRQGTKGAAWDLRLYVREFDFGLDEVRMPLTWFHGEGDMNSPIALARRVVAAIPNARLVSYEREAHLSTLCNHLDEIAEAIKRQSSPARSHRRVLPTR